MIYNKPAIIFLKANRRLTYFWNYNDENEHEITYKNCLFGRSHYFLVIIQLFKANN